jgi:hypothetical protein
MHMRHKRSEHAHDVTLQEDWINSVGRAIVRHSKRYACHGHRSW